eukprot:scaffold34653_cov254-Amphora_coffeaeformis.AAC.1
MEGWNAVDNISIGGDCNYGSNPPPTLSYAAIHTQPSWPENHAHKAKEVLEASEHKLIHHMKTADTMLGSLQMDKCKAEQEFKIAEERLAKVERITERLCDDCFRVLPVLGKDFSSPHGVKDIDNGSEDTTTTTTTTTPCRRSCLACGKPVDLPPAALSVPPLVSTSLQAADRALQYFENPQHQCHEGTSLVNTHTVSPWQSRHVTNPYSMVGTPSKAPSLFKLVQKCDYLIAARDSVRAAQHHLENIQDAVHQWT